MDTRKGASDRLSYNAFNGATAFQPWIPNDEVIASNPALAPSMEPRPFSRGYHDTRFWPSRGVFFRFNGATAFQPWILDLLQPAPCVEGMPSMEPRPFSRGYNKAIIRQSTVHPSHRSHGLSAVGYTKGASDRLSYNAFHGSHGLSAVEHLTTRLSPQTPALPLIGATAFQPWIRKLGTGARLPKPTFHGATAFQPWIPSRKS